MNAGVIFLCILVVGSAFAGILITFRQIVKGPAQKPHQKQEDKKP